jgi:hypothetical protein
MHRRGHHRPGGLVAHADEAHRVLPRQRVHQRRQLAADDAEGERHPLRRQHAHQRLGARESDHGVSPPP